MQIYVDLDGVLADFDAGYERAFGRKPCKVADDVDWTLVRDTPGFYAHLPAMPDMRELWLHVEPYKPIVLTGCPSQVPESSRDKRAWVRDRLGSQVGVITCRSKDKSLFCRPGDILIDDWDKYRHLWIKAGGRWITHTSAAESIRQIRPLNPEPTASQVCGRAPWALDCPMPLLLKPNITALQCRKCGMVWSGGMVQPTAERRLR